uniref:Transmembrane protein n=1 Tax=Cannabis sativa TaxID=3483 RepID=A0A803R1A7_CANSA
MNMGKSYVINMLSMLVLLNLAMITLLPYAHARHKFPPPPPPPIRSPIQSPVTPIPRPTHTHHAALRRSRQDHTQLYHHRASKSIFTFF